MNVPLSLRAEIFVQMIERNFFFEKCAAKIANVDHRFCAKRIKRLVKILIFRIKKILKIFHDEMIMKNSIFRTNQNLSAEFVL